MTSIADKTAQYRAVLQSLQDWEPYLCANSGLPGPRGNLELAQAAADLASPAQIERLLSFTPDTAPENTPEVFLAVCGAIALGRLAVEGQSDVIPRLKALANDPRWRVREGVAMALQRLGDFDKEKIIEIALAWSKGTFLEQRAAVAAICEPRLLVESRHARSALDLLDKVTHNILSAGDRRDEDFIALRKCLGYAWSVALAAYPEAGKANFEKWLSYPDKDICWILRENLKKNRLEKMDPEWVRNMQARLIEL